MTHHLTLVVDNSDIPRVSDHPAKQARKTADALETRDNRWVHRSWRPRQRARRATGRVPVRAVGSVLGNERGAVTAEYAIVILAAVAFAGLLVAIMRSGEIREMLVGLVQNALGAAG